jgi:peptide chain release factor 1
MPDFSAQMDAVCHRFEELSVRLNQPDAAADPALFRKLMRDYHETQPVVQAYRDWQTARDHLAQAKALLEGEALDRRTHLRSGLQADDTAGNQRKKSGCGKAGK